MTGTLPTGVTFDSTTGTFTSDGTQTADETTSVSVTVSSANGSSVSATATITLEVSTDTSIIDPIITDSLTLFIPCKTGYAAQEGIDLVSIGTNSPSATIDGGKECLYFDGTAALANSNNNYVTIYSLGGPNATLCFWYRQAEQQSSDSCAAQIGNDNGYATDTGVGLKSRSNTTREIQEVFGHWSSTVTNSNNVWHFYAMVLQRINGTTHVRLDTWVDGVKTEQIYGTRAYPIVFSPTICLGANIKTFSPLVFQNSSIFTKGYMTRVRLYNRILTTEEIQTLAAEFTPTT